MTLYTRLIYRGSYKEFPALACVRFGSRHACEPSGKYLDKPSRPGHHYAPLNAWISCESTVLPADADCNTASAKPSACRRKNQTAEAQRFILLRKQCAASVRQLYPGSHQQNLAATTTQSCWWRQETIGAFLIAESKLSWLSGIEAAWTNSKTFGASAHCLATIHRVALGIHVGRQA